MLKFSNALKLLEEHILDYYHRFNHYSTLVLIELVHNYGWSFASIPGHIQKNVKGVSGGQLNPDGIHTVYGRFDDSGRYLVLESGFDSVFDIDCRDKTAKLAAKEFNARAVREIQLFKICKQKCQQCQQHCCVK